MSEESVKVFISYSWDSNEHKDKVLGLAQSLRDDGVECTIDQFVLAPDNWDRWMLDQIDDSKYVLIICSERYYRRYRGKEEVNKGLGVTWESTLIMGKLHDDQGKNSKFYLVFFNSPDCDIILPGIRTSFFDLSGYDLLNLEKEENRLINNGGYKDLYRLLTNQPGVLPKKVGSVKNLEAVNREGEQQATEKDKKQPKTSIATEADVFSNRDPVAIEESRAIATEADVLLDQFEANYQSALRQIRKAGRSGLGLGASTMKQSLDP